MGSNIMDCYKITPDKQKMKRFLFYWFIANAISISFMVILSGTVQYYLPEYIPIGLGMYADTQEFFMLWGVAIFTLVNIIFAYCYFKKKHPKHRKKGRR